jgi:hypothetical protein
MSSPIERFLSDTYEVRRSRGGSYVDGFFKAEEDDVLKVRGSMQPTNARELKLSEEGTRLREYFKFYTDIQVLPINSKTLARSDTITINNETYKVMSQTIWQGLRFGMNYYMSVLYREPTQ